MKNLYNIEALHFKDDKKELFATTRNTPVTAVTISIGKGGDVAMALATAALSDVDSDYFFVLKGNEESYPQWAGYKLIRLIDRIKTDASVYLGYSSYLDEWIISDWLNLEFTPKESLMMVGENLPWGATDLRDAYDFANEMLGLENRDFKSYSEKRLKGK